MAQTVQQCTNEWWGWGTDYKYYFFFYKGRQVHIGILSGQIVSTAHIWRTFADVRPMFRKADYHGNYETAYCTTISVAGEAYHAAVWRLGAKSLLSGEFCGRGGGNEPRRLRQKLLPVSFTRAADRASGNVHKRVERRRNESSFDFSGKILVPHVFPLPADSCFLWSFLHSSCWFWLC